ncbi:MAG: hypothetical protein KDA78_12480 [Planctomycetaceae bacterium]|nr:hypothetical protein [Planctomycetaceae bacterium]
MTSLNPLRLILRRWDITPPCIHGGEFQEVIAPYRQHPQISQLIEPRSDSSTYDCLGCGSGHRCDVTYLVDAEGNDIPFLCCPECGPYQLDPVQLQRWQISTSRALKFLFELMQVRTEIAQVVEPCLWSVGKARWQGRSRTILFVVGNLSAAAAEHVSRYRQAVLFVASTRCRQRIEGTIDTLMFDLESLLDYDGEAIRFDLRDVEDVLLERDQIQKAQSEEKPRQRDLAGRNIERLKKELIQLVMGARDHYQATKYVSTPRKYPRPNQKALAEMTGISRSSICRYLRDEANTELRELWATLDDPEKILRYSGPIRFQEQEEDEEE